MIVNIERFINRCTHPFIMGKEAAQHSYMRTYDNIKIEEGLVALPTEILNVVKRRNGENNYLHTAPIHYGSERCTAYFDSKGYEALDKAMGEGATELILDPQGRGLIRLMLSKIEKVDVNENDVGIHSDLLTRMYCSDDLLLLGVGGWFELWGEKQLEAWIDAVDYEKAAENLDTK